MRISIRIESGQLSLFINDDCYFRCFYCNIFVVIFDMIEGFGNRLLPLFISAPDIVFLHLCGINGLTPNMIKGLRPLYDLNDMALRNTLVRQTGNALMVQ